jgi:hypothetical protein
MQVETEQSGDAQFESSGYIEQAGGASSELGSQLARKLAASRECLLRQCA